jgi:hypothetical protein
MRTIRNKNQVNATAIELAAMLEKDHGHAYAMSVTRKIFELTASEGLRLSDALRQTRQLNAIGL